MIIDGQTGAVIEHEQSIAKPEPAPQPQPPSHPLVEIVRAVSKARTPADLLGIGLSVLANQILTKTLKPAPKSQHHKPRIKKRRRKNPARRLLR